MRTYFKKLGIPGPTPLPIFGNLIGFFRRGIYKYDTETLIKYNRTCGIFDGTTPSILTSDPKFIKEVMIKESSKFVNRRVFEGLSIDPVDKFLTVLKDEEWKNVRTVITTSFTSGKLKEMTKLIVGCSKSASAFVENYAKKGENLEAKTLFGSFTLDVISSCLFGFDANSFENPNNEFIQHLKSAFSSTFSFKLVIVLAFPRLSKYLAEFKILNFISPKTMNFLKDVSQQIIERRRAKLEVRSDFIQNMVDHQEQANKTEADEAANKQEESPKTSQDDEKAGSKWKSLKKTLTDKEILSQASLFLVAGYETTGNTLTFVAYNLVMNPEYQDKLREEIDEVLERHKGEINYESISEMKYMEQIINETLRLFPPAVRTDRICDEDHEYNGIKIPKGSIWTACIWAMHHDPELYPEPEKFMPERFDEDAKKLRENEAFIPFGSGQRACIGMRFALIEMKAILTEILSKYKLVPCEKTPKEIVMDKSGLGRPTEPIVFKVVPREQD